MTSLNVKRAINRSEWTIKGHVCGQIKSTLVLITKT